MERFATTYFFDEIFPNYDKWKEFSHQTSAIGNNPSPDIENFDHYCYNILFRQFAKQNIRYDSIEMFLNELANIYDQKFTAFYREKELVDSIFKLSFKELEMVNQTISNVANNPNTQPDDPTKPLKFVSAQTFTQIGDNKLQAYLQALNNLPSLNIERFIYGERADPNNKKFMHFIDLFMQVLPNNFEIYEKGEN